MQNIDKLRKEYSTAKLDESTVENNPFDLFQRWFLEAVNAGIDEPNAMVLGTCSPLGIPSTRTVLLKHFDEKGLCFFTNYESQKARELILNPYASITFLWKELERQINIQGTVIKTPEEEAKEYFAKRPPKSQLGAWASQQSQIVESREVLEKAFKHFEEKFTGQTIPKPPHWGGFRIIPFRFEFWQGRASRLHDRLCYQLEKDAWQLNRLSP